MATYLQKLGVYWIIAILLTAVKFFPDFILSLHWGIGLLLVSLLVGSWLWFIFVVYYDAQEIGVSENWWVATFFFGPIGATIYYLKTKNEREQY